MVYVLLKVKIITTSYIELNHPRTSKEIANLILQIRTGFHARSVATSIQADEDSWKHIVQLLISEASLVIVDLTDFTENLKWELEASIKLLPPENIILLNRNPIDFDSFDSSQRQSVILRDLYDSKEISRFPKFSYPENGISFFERLKQRKKKYQKLRNIMANSLDGYDPFPPDNYKIEVSIMRELFSIRFWLSDNSKSGKVNKLRDNHKKK